MIWPNMDSTLEGPADDAMLGPEGETRGGEKEEKKKRRDGDT